MNAHFSDSADKIDVRYVANLARLNLTPDEVTHFQEQLERILEYVNQLGELDVEGLEPTSHAIPVQNVVRDDVPRPSLEHGKAMDNAPSQRTGMFAVPKIVE